MVINTGEFLFLARTILCSIGRLPDGLVHPVETAFKVGNYLGLSPEDFVEMHPPNGARNYCCGGGGGLESTGDYGQMRISVGKKKLSKSIDFVVESVLSFVFNQLLELTLPHALNAVGLSFIRHFRHLILINFSVKVCLPIFAGKLVVLVWIIRIFDIKIFATAYRALHRRHLLV
ncbi:MAG: hypothetical protein PVH58_03725, partial [Desulfobacterales bacterium]